MTAPPPTAYTLEERTEAIRRERAKRLPKHPDHTPEERAALRVWEEKVVHDQMLQQLNDVLDQQQKGLSEPSKSMDAPYKWRQDVNEVLTDWQVSGFHARDAYQEGVRCDISASTYTGQLRAGKRHGKGCLRFDSGECYEGEFVDDSYSGHGTETTSIGHRYVGEFKAGRKQGKGTFYWMDGRRYEGHWHADSMLGYGVMEWRDGRKYHGIFRDDDFDGDGIFLWPDGSKLDGSFRAGRAVAGTLTEADGSRFRVRYGRDKPGAKVAKASMWLGQPSTSLICFGTLPEPEVKEPHTGREEVVPPRTSGVAQPNGKQGDLARKVPF